MALTKFKASPLPNPSTEYDAQYIRQVIRVLETYFSQLDSNTPNYAQSYTADEFVGGTFTGTFSGTFSGTGLDITVPYGQFQSDVDQTAAAIDVAYPITYTASDFTGGVTLSSGSRLTVPNAGIYVVSFSIQLTNSTNATQDVDIWLRKNGTDIPATNSRFGLEQRKSVGNPSHIIAATPVMVQLAANDYVQVVWHATATGVSIEALPAVTYSAGVTPAHPATPSAIVQVEYVSKVTNVAASATLTGVSATGSIGTVTVTV
jgi:hypothetical protein